MAQSERLEDKLRRRIAEERARESTITADGIYQRIAAGDIVRATGSLLYHTPAPEFVGVLRDVLEEIRDLYPEADPVLGENILHFLVKLGIDLRSYLPNWTLADEMDGEAILSAAERVTKVLGSLEELGGESLERVRRRLLDETLARLNAEAVEGEEAGDLAAGLLGNSLVDYVLNIAREVNSSNLIVVARARRRGETISELGNDYAAFLQYTIWLGSSFVTTNPVLIKMAWDINPAYWNRQVDEQISERYTPEELRTILAGSGEEIDKAVEEINSLVTLCVVEENCRLLRDIFLVTGGQEGYVSLQVNPRNHADGEAMVREARELYAGLERRLGGVPNVVFKLPATAGGLVAAAELTAEGIGVNITVNFSVFQEVGFGEVLQRGHALVSYLALMNGRMSFPVRDDLKERGVAGGVEAARWAGVEVARKAYHRLYYPPAQGGLGIDPGRVRLLIASLRIYEDWLPDISELWGCPVITIFPNVRRTWDSHPREFDGEAVLGITPAEDLRTMLQGEVFRQAWWMPGDPEEWKPQRVLSLEPADAEALLAWPPVAQTLGQFVELYTQMGELVLERMRRLAQ